MRRSYLPTALALAAIPAAAQVRIGRVPVSGASGIVVPITGFIGGQGIAPASLPSLTLSLVPSLSAPAVSPTIRAGVVVAVVQTPFALQASVLPAASKANDIRAEAAKTVASWKAAKIPATAVQTAIPAVPDATSRRQLLKPPPSPWLTNLDALFDGSLPASRAVLERAAARGVSDAVLGAAIADSKTVADAAARLAALGLLSREETALAGPDEDHFRFLLTRLWRRTAPSVPAPFKVDESWGVPALKVERGGATYFVHGVSHGRLRPPRRGAVLGLVRRVVAAGHALYSEQNLPAYYGYAAGRETLDHAAASGGAVAVVPAAQGASSASLFLKRALDWTVAPGSALAALGWALTSPGQPLPWLVLAALAVLSWVVLTGGLPLMRARRRRRSAQARADGLEDMADQYADEAANFFVSRPNLETLRGLELPQPLGAGSDPFSTRSRAIADSVVSHGEGAVHLIVGHMHAHEVAWRLAHPAGGTEVLGAGPRSPKREAQVS